MRWFKRLLFVVFVLLMLLLLSLWAVIKHPTISAWTLTKVVQHYPDVAVEQISGSLWDGLALSGLVIRQGDNTFVVEDVFVRWHWQDLWQKHQLSVAEFRLGRVAVDINAAEQSSTDAQFDWRRPEIPDIGLPIALQLQQLSLRNLSILLADDRVIELHDVAVSLELAHQKLRLKQLSALMQTPVRSQMIVSGEAGLLAPHAISLGGDAELFEPEWGEARASIMMTGDVQQVVLHVDAAGDSTRLGALLAQGDIWLSPEQACSPEFKLVSSLGQLSILNAQADWSSQLSLTGIARVDAYQNRLEMRGQFLPQPDASLRVDAVNLSHFNRLFPLAGKLHATGKLKGSWQAPEGDMALKAQGLAWQAHRVEQVSLNAQGDTQKFAAQLQAQGFSDAGEGSRLDLNWSGSLAQHQLKLAARAWGVSVSAQAAGGLSDAWQWSGRLSQLQLIHADAGLWQQQAPVGLTADAVSFALHQALCLQQLRSKVCVTQASVSEKQGVRLAATADELYLSRFQPWLPESLKLHGKAQASVQFNQQGQLRKAQFELILPSSQFSYTTLSGQQTFNYDSVNLTAQLNNQQLDTQLVAKLKQGVSLNTRSHHTLGEWEALDVQGNINVENLAIAQPLLTDITGLTGAMTGSFNLTGKLNQPQLNAQLQLIALKLTPVVTGVEFSLPQVSFDIKPTGMVSINGQLLAGGGQSSLKGWGNVAHWSKWNLDLLVQGQNLLIAKTPQADIWLSPNIQVSATPHQVDILGQLIIPKARLRVQSVSSKAIGLSDDVMLVGATKTTTNMALIPHMRVLLGDDISITGAGLSSQLTGQLEITRSRLGNLLFQGEVNTQNGQFKAYQQDLTIEQGKILFNGVSDNPGLSVVATRKILDETVGVRVTGSLVKPKLTVFSRPTMPDTDALSLLVLGKKTRDMTATDAAILAAKLATENDEDPLLQRLGDSAGLDVGLTHVKGEKNTGLSVGKRLSPDLYVRYVVGAFETGARWITEYRISKLFSLEVQAGQFPGGDIFYRYEGE